MKKELLSVNMIFRSIEVKCIIILLILIVYYIVRMTAEHGVLYRRLPNTESIIDGQHTVAWLDI